MFSIIVSQNSICVSKMLNENSVRKKFLKQKAKNTIQFEIYVEKRDDENHKLKYRILTPLFIFFKVDLDT